MPEPTLNLSVFPRLMMLPMGNQLGSISVMQMFPWIGSLKARSTQANRVAEVKNSSIRVAENELIWKVKNAWYPLFELEAKIRIQNDLLRVLEAGKELATDRFQYGQAPMVDAIRADIMIDEVKTEIALLEQKRKPLLVAFNRLLNRKDDTPVPISGGLPEPEGVARRDSLLDHNPVLTVFNNRIQASAAEEKARTFMRKPVIGAGIQYMPLVKRSSRDLFPNTGMDMVMPMASMTIPIWSKKYDAAVEESRLEQIALADRKLEMENDLATMYEMTWYDLEKNAQTYALLNTQTVKTQQAIDLLLSSYSNAGKDFEEILRMQRQLFRYQMEKVSAQTQYQLTCAKLDYLTGR
ncbi:MAG: TolC family protein [Saprospirales bacterium]|nr:TolC family protein [Saprospirales bacterium]